MAKSKIYYSEFETLRGDTVSVEIWKEGGTGSEELILNGDEPVVIEYTQDTVFDTLKLSTCTVNVITDVPLLELYTGTLSDVELRVYRTANTAGAGAKSGGTATTNGAKMVWYGFMSPNVYSMPYDSKNNQLGLEFVDPLNAMDSVRFRRYGDEMFFDTFEGYITKALEKVGASMTIVGIPDDMKNVGCMQRNFIDETNDEEDGSSSWQDVMSYIARYLNMTMCCQGDVICLYDALENSGALDMQTLGIAGADGNVSLGEMYNKVTVVANNNPLDSAIPDPLDDTAWQFNMDIDENFYTSKYINGQIYPSMILYNSKEDYTNYKLFNAGYKSNQWAVSDDLIYSKGTFQTALQAYYIGDPRTTSVEHAVRFDLLYTGTSKAWYLQDTYINGAFFQRYASVEDDGTVVSSLSWGKCLSLYPGTSAYLSDKPQFVGQNGYLVLSLKFMPSPWVYPQQVMQSVTLKPESRSSAWGFECQLAIGNRYLTKNDEGKYIWTNDSSATFTLVHTFEDDEEVRTGEEIAIDNEVSYTLGLNTDNEGALIPLSSDVMNGEISFSIKNAITDIVPTNSIYTHITELSLVYVTADTVKDIFNMEEYDADVTYTNVVDEDNVEEAEDVEFRINTYTAKAVSASYAMKKDASSGEYTYVVPEDGEPNQEQKCIKRMVEYYKEPKMTYEITLENTSGKYIEVTDNISAAWLGKTFTVGGVTYDLMENTATCKLLEL